MKPLQTLVGFLLISSFTSAAGALDLKSYELASKLANVVASEKFCALKYNQSAIEKWVSENVEPGDLQFTENLTGAVALARMMNNQMSQSEKTAHCTQVSRAAKHYGFID